jgi:hypothetical protein
MTLAPASTNADTRSLPIPPAAPVMRTCFLDRLTTTELYCYACEIRDRDTNQLFGKTGKAH